MVKDEKAEYLENAGLFRRAADRWLDILPEHNSKCQEWIIQRRNICLSKAHRVRKVNKDNFIDVSRAASALQKKMGLDKPDAITLRLSCVKKKKKLIIRE
jgi:hypothetical protein